MVDLCAREVGDLFEAGCTWPEAGACTVEREAEPLFIVAELFVPLERSTTSLGRVLIAPCDIPKDSQ